MKLISDLKEFFSVNGRLNDEREKCLYLKGEMDEQLNSLKRISKTLSGEIPEHHADENGKSWIYLKKNNFLVDIEDIFEKAKKE